MPDIAITIRGEEHIVAVGPELAATVAEAEAAGEIISAQTYVEPPPEPEPAPRELDPDTGAPVPPGPQPRLDESADAEALDEDALAQRVQDDHFLVGPAHIQQALWASEKTTALKLDAKSSAYKALPMETWRSLAKWSVVNEREWRIDGFTCSSFALVFPADCHLMLARGVGYVSDDLEGHALNILIVASEPGDPGSHEVSTAGGPRHFRLVAFEPQQDRFIEIGEAKTRAGTVTFF